MTGSAVREIYSTLEESENDDYDVIKQKLKDHFASLKNTDYVHILSNAANGQ